MRKLSAIFLSTFINMIYCCWPILLVVGSASAKETTGSHGFISFFTRIKQRIISAIMHHQTTLSSTAFYQNCTDGTPAISFEAQTLLSLIGKPSLVSEADIAVLEESFVVAYNELETCTSLGTGRILDKATIIYDGILTTNTNVSVSASSANLPMKAFTYLLIAQGRSCNFCGPTSSILLFDNASSSGSTVKNGNHLRRLQRISASLDIGQYNSALSDSTEI